MNVMRIGNWCFRPGLWPTLATVLLLPALVGLGLWQLDRAAQKQRLQQEYDERLASPPVQLTGDPVDPMSIRYRRVMVRGHYDLAHEILLENRVHQGQAGYHVLTPLVIFSSRQVVLINRGWIALGPDRRERPATPAPAGDVVVTGIAAPPPGIGLRLGAAYNEDGGWPVTWQYLDIPAYAARAKRPVLPIVVLMDPDSTAGGFVRQWARLDAGIATHHGYALTWFSLAAVLVVIYIFLNTQRCIEPAHE